MAEVSPWEFLRQQGSTLVCFHLCAEQLVLGLGCSEQPAVVPQCIAYRRNSRAGATVPDHAGSSSQLWPQQQAFDALVQVQRLLHLPALPKPQALEASNQQQKQEQRQQQQDEPGDAFPAANAGLVSQKDIPEGSDGFIWLDDKQQEKLLQRQRQLRQQQQQQQSAHNSMQQQPQQQKQPCFAGGQVPALWPPDEYEAHWLLTPDNHIAGLDSTPQHVLLDRFEEVWGWALLQLGLPPARCRHLSAVLAVPVDMTAAEIRLLADLLLGRLGFAALLVHLEPVAAAFGNGTTSACVINVGSSSCTVCCVDDAVVLLPQHSRLSLPYGLVSIAGALTGWMSCYGHWPVQLLRQGLGHSSSSSGSSGGTAGAEQDKQQQQQGYGVLTPAGIYSMLLLEDLVLQQCYLPKENKQAGLLGQPMLETQPPAVVPVRIPGRPTTNFEVSLGIWAAAAAMALLYPDLAPPGHGTAQHSAAHNAAAGDSAAGVQVKPDPGAGSEDIIAAAAAAGAPEHTAAGSGAAAAAEAAAQSDTAAAQAMHCRYHACALELPAAEALHLQSQLRARLEAGETAPIPDGMYLLPLELSDRHAVTAAAGAPVGTPAAAAAAGSGRVKGSGGASSGSTPGAVQQQHSGGSAAAASGGDGSEQVVAVGELKVATAAAAAGGSSAAGVAAGSSPGCGSSGGAGGKASSIGLDEAVYNSIVACSVGRPELTSRLAAGLLLVGPGGGLRGLGQMLEQRVSQRFAAARQPQVVSTLEQRADPAHVVWKGAALLAALDSGRENWLPRHQWVGGGMVLPAPQAAAAGPGGPSSSTLAAVAAALELPGKSKLGGAGAAASGAAAGAGSGANAAAARHTKLFYYCRAEQGMLQ